MKIRVPRPRFSDLGWLPSPAPATARCTPGAPEHSESTARRPSGQQLATPILIAPSGRPRDSTPQLVKHAPSPRFRILLFPQADTSQRGRAGYFPQFATLELRAATSWRRATTFWDNLPSCPASNADADCKFFVLKISALKFLKTADLLENPAL